jgi:hypothetical protein
MKHCKGAQAIKFWNLWTIDYNRQVLEACLDGW